MQVTRTTIQFQMGLKFRTIIPGTAELAAPELLEKLPQTYNGRNIVTTLVPSFLDGSSTFLQVTRLAIKAWMSWNFILISLPATEYAALERLKNQ